MRLPVNHALPLATLIALVAAPVAGKDRHAAETGNGPAADYPVIVGDPFTIDGTTWTPADQLNYDAVGYAQTGEPDLAGVSAAHKTLPLPSYAEVTALDSGRTILVRITRRGPMTNETLAGLSPEATAQLGLPPGTRAAIRIRRVNPPEMERSLLRGGMRAAERMATPEGLLKVLRRKLAQQSPLVPPPSTPPAMPKGPPAQQYASVAPAEHPAIASEMPSAPAEIVEQADVPAAHIAPTPAENREGGPRPKGSQVVQVGMFSMEANARKVAGKLGTRPVRSGRFWRVRLGPFANGAQAAAALEKARAAGYSDARIQRAD